MSTQSSKVFNPNVAPPMSPPNTEPLQNALRRFMKGEYALVLQERGPESAGRALIKFLIANKVKMIATDFDLTMTTQHTGGCIPAEQVEGHPCTNCVSPIFNEWATQAVELGLRFTVVTFADEKSLRGRPGLGGQDLILTNLRNGGCSFRVEKIYPYYPNNYRGPEACRALGLDAPMHGSKRFHLRKVCHDFDLQPWEIMLLDDDQRNCVTAAADGFLSMHVGGHNGLDLTQISPA